MVFNIILFPDFETLDVFGPVEVFGKLEDSEIRYFSLNGGIKGNGDNIKIETEPIENIRFMGANALFIPGGMGTRVEINNELFIQKLAALAEKSQYVLTVCTGSALLAKTGLLDGKRATSNKRSFDWVVASSENVDWIKKARWVVDGKYYTSSGISAGIDMALGFISHIAGSEKAGDIAYRMEYNWQRDKDADDFCNQQSSI